MNYFKMPSIFWHRNLFTHRHLLTLPTPSLWRNSSNGTIGPFSCSTRWRWVLRWWVSGMMAVLQCLGEMQLHIGKSRKKELWPGEIPSPQLALFTRRRCCCSLQVDQFFSLACLFLWRYTCIVFRGIWDCHVRRSRIQYPEVPINIHHSWPFLSSTCTCENILVRENIPRYLKNIEVSQQGKMSLLWLWLWEVQS